MCAELHRMSQGSGRLGSVRPFRSRCRAPGSAGLRWTGLTRPGPVWGRRRARTQSEPSREGETTSQVMITRRDSHTSVTHPAPPPARYKQEKLGHFNNRLSPLVIKALGGQAGQSGLSMWVCRVLSRVPVSCVCLCLPECEPPTKY